MIVLDNNFPPVKPPDNQFYELVASRLYLYDRASVRVDCYAPVGEVPTARLNEENYPPVYWLVKCDGHAPEFGTDLDEVAALINRWTQDMAFINSFTGCVGVAHEP